MIAPETDAAWLLEAWQRCARSEMLAGRAECRRLALGFLGPNLARDLANFFWGLANAGSLPLAGGVTAAEVDRWMQARSEPERWDLLILPRARTELDRGPDRREPWRRIHLWLGREAVLHHLRSSDAQTLAYTWALDTFRAAVPAGGRLPDPCRGRNPAVLRAFQGWWADASGRLDRWLRDEGWGRLRGLEEAVWARLLARVLHPDPCPEDRPCPLARLVEAMNRQWRVCLGERNFRRIAPLNEEWFASMAGRLLAAAEGGYPLEWSGGDRMQWVRLWRWVQDNGLDEELESVPLPEPGEVNVPVVIGPGQVDLLVEWWSRLQETWEDPRASTLYAEDLFGRRGPTRFADWLAEARRVFPG